MDKIDKSLLENITDLHSLTQSAYNIRKNGEVVARNCTDNIQIVPKQDKPGIDIHIASNLKNQSLHIPVIITEGNLHDLVYNDFYIGDNTEILIVAGCGLHNDTKESSSHQGIHQFFVGKNCLIRYVEKHLAQGNADTQKNLNPTTIIYLGQNSRFIMETTQLAGVNSSERVTEIELDDNATMEVKESILLQNTETSSSTFSVNLNGINSRLNLISRSVSKDNSNLDFISEVYGNNQCFGHIECDAIIVGNGTVSSTPALANLHPDANLSHEAVIGKIAGEQIIKLQTLGMTKEQAEEAIIKGFLK